MSACSHSRRLVSRVQRPLLSSSSMCICCQHQHLGGFWLNVGLRFSVLTPFKFQDRVSSSKHTDLCLVRSAFSICFCSRVCDPSQGHVLLTVGDLRISLPPCDLTSELMPYAVLSAWLSHSAAASQKTQGHHASCSSFVICLKMLWFHSISCHDVFNELDTLKTTVGKTF